MVKPFNEREKEIIIERLKEKGGELICRLGIKKTGIGDITEAAGIGRGTFYHFFKSKEEFAISLIEETENKVKLELMNAISNSTNINEAFGLFIRTSFFILDKNPILKTVIENKEDFELLLRNTPKERLSLLLANDDKAVEEVLALFSRYGVKIEVPASVFSGLLRSVMLMPLNKELIGKEVFESVVNLLAESVAEKILKKSGGK